MSTDKPCRHKYKMIVNKQALPAESGKSESIVARGICEKFSMAGFGGRGDHVTPSDDQPGNAASVVQIEGTECCQPPE